MQVAEVAHGADGERRIELSDGGLGGVGGVVVAANLLQLLQPRGPARGVVVLGVQALQRGVVEELQQRGRGGRRLAVAQPCGIVAAASVELLHLRLEVGVVRPAQAVELWRAHDLLDGSSVVTAALRPGSALAAGEGQQGREQEKGNADAAKGRAGGRQQASLKRSKVERRSVASKCRA